ncbi:protein TALPID3-like isoform X2 [Sebastes fasciatus]|uniref:protein TALPID3-like isoform X2 n=1 Tax=Sebastes fasciatus TaxID=394691 RepID=UPI003D9DBED6
MGRLKTEMKMLLTPEDSLSSTRTGPDHHQSQQNHLQSQSQSQSQCQSQTQSQSQSTQGPLQQIQSQQNPSHPNHLQSKSQQTESQSHQSPVQQTQSQLSQQSQSVLVQRRPVVPSMLEEAGLVLRQVRRQKKVLEENLEALLRAQTGEVLHCQLEALAANRDWTEEVRIKKTVDAWINTQTRDIQAEMSSEDAAMTSQQRTAGSSAHTGRGRPVSALRGTGSKTAAGRGSRGPLQGAEPEGATGESYLTRLYGRAPYEGLRRTLKKSPYLRFSSPASPLGRKSRPRLVESVTGVKVKSCKTQTCLAPQRRDIISPSHLTSGDPADLTVSPAGGCSVPMAIPLGRPRMDSSSRCLAERQQEVTSPPTTPPTSGAVAVDDRQQEEEQLDAPPPPPPPPPVDIIQRKSEEEEDEEDVFPGTDFLSVADVIQEEMSVVSEEVLELDGGPSPPPVLYQGPVFPPQARSALPVQDQASVLGLNLHRDALEDRLVEWVEQQLMSRVISAMYRSPPSDPAHNDSTDQSESEEQSVTSDIVEAAGGGGLQLFVDSNTSVDSALIRRLVSEVLTEHVALMLGHRDSLEMGTEPGLEPSEPGPGAHQEDKLVPPVPTPVPTPPTSPAPPSRETQPLTTPPPSEPTSLLDHESPQPITAPEPVATPTSSPEPTHSAGSPPADHQAPPPLTWGDAELPLDEERPEEHPDARPQPLVMSVAEEEPPLSSPPPPPSGPDPRPASPSGPVPRPASPSGPVPRPASPSGPDPDQRPSPAPQRTPAAPQ